MHLLQTTTVRQTDDNSYHKLDRFVGKKHCGGGLHTEQLSINSGLAAP